MLVLLNFLLNHHFVKFFVSTKVAVFHFQSFFYSLKFVAFLYVVCKGFIYSHILLVDGPRRFIKIPVIENVLIGCT